MNDVAKEISRKSKSSFYYAFNLLPTDKRDAMNTVYAFCRKTDDIIDEDGESVEVKYEMLRKWRIELEKAFNGTSNFSLLNKLAKTGVGSAPRWSSITSRKPWRSGAAARAGPSSPRFYRCSGSRSRRVRACSGLCPE